MEKPTLETLLPLDSSSNLIQPNAPLLQTYIQAATSHNTRKAYQSDIRQFIASGGLLPCSTENLLHYLQEQASKLNPRTLKRRLVAIKQWHIYQGFPDPTLHPLVKKTLSGIFWCFSSK